MTSRVEGHRLVFDTLDGETVTASLNLKRSQWTAYREFQDREGNPSVEEVYDYLELLVGDDVDKLGMLDAMAFIGDWMDAFSEAVGLTTGESNGSSTQSSDSTAEPSPSTSGTTSTRRSQK